MSKVIIIGAGISGLSAGIYAQKYGFRSQIFEMHSIAGGQCTGWDRDGYHIDGSIHWLSGTRKGTVLNKLWHEIGAINDIEIYQPEYFSCTMGDKEKVFIYSNKERLQKHLIEISPEDENEIVNLLNLSMVYSNFEPPYDQPCDQPQYTPLFVRISEKLNSIKYWRKRSTQLDYNRITVEEYVEHFKNPSIRYSLKSLLPTSYKASDLFFMLGSFLSGNAGKPMGGSRSFANRIADYYSTLGGVISYNKEVKLVNIENGIAKSVILKDGSEHEGDYIIIACDPKVIFNKLIPDKFMPLEFKKRYRRPYIYPLISCCFLSFRIDKDLKDYPSVIHFKTVPVKVEDHEIDELSITHYCLEPNFSPEGKSIITVHLYANYDWWKEKRNTIENYKTEKIQLANRIIDRIEKRFPELKDKIHLLDVATPLTYERFCGAYKGAYMSFGDTPNAIPLKSQKISQLLKNVFLAGQWLLPPGGLPNAALTGKWAADNIRDLEK
jgi:phytoene dehydrogenase-like protein